MSETTETDQIERDLARTRARMDNRLDELQGRLSPGQLVNDAFAYFKGGDGADFTQEVISKLKANPLPALLTGVGLAWLMASSGRQSAASSRGSYQPDLTSRLRDAEAQTVRLPDEHVDVHAARLDDARGRVLGITRNSSDTDTSYSQRIKDAVASATQRVRETAHDLSASASHVAGSIGERAQNHAYATQEGMTSMVRSTRDTLASATSNPFALGAVAALVGIVAGSLIPTTEEEEHALGATADKLRSAGRDLAQDVVDRGTRVASEALGAVKDSAEAHGLTGDKPVGEMVADLKSGALAGAVKQVAGEAVSAGKDSVQTHLASSGNEAGGGHQRSDNEQTLR